MLHVLLILSSLANTSATVDEEGFELISDKREVAQLQVAVEPALEAIGACSEHTGGLDYGELSLSFMVDKKGKTANHSVRSRYVMPMPLTRCLTASLEDISLGRGDVAVAKLKVRLP